MFAVLHTPSMAVTQRLMVINVLLILLIMGSSASVAWVLIRRSLRQRVEAARMAAMGTATARILHQIKNPLQSVLLHAEMLDDDRLVEDREVRREVCRAIVSQAMRVTDLLSELSAYASGVARRVSPEPMPLSELVESTLRDVAREGRCDGVEIVADSSADVVVQADGYLLKQALENVIHNACEALAEVEAGAPRKVEVSVRRRGADAIIEVRDTGPGMDAERSAVALEPFVTTKGTGMGLGLPICREIVEGHGGRLELRSRPGAGTTVTLVLPVSSALSELLQPA